MRTIAADDLLTVSEAARVLAGLDRPVSAATVRLWADAGKIPTVRTAYGVRLFRRSDVEDLAPGRAAVACGATA